MKTFRLMLGAAVAVTGLALASTANAAPAGVKVGELVCNVSSGWGFIVGSSKDLHCSYRPTNRRSEHYTGSINKWGVDLGYTDGGVLVWGVFAPASDIRPGALEGVYAGASAQATVGGPRPSSGSSSRIAALRAYRTGSEVSTLPRKAWLPSLCASLLLGT